MMVYAKEVKVIGKEVFSLQFAVRGVYSFEFSVCDKAKIPNPYF
jgi:hypothetical protein